MTSCLSLNSALSLVQQRYMSTSVYEVFGRLSHVGTFVFQHNAWLDSGFLLIRQTTQALTGTGRFPWSCCSADHGDSTIAALECGDRCPCCFGHAGSLPVVAQRPFLMVKPVWQTIEISQLQYALGGLRSCYAGRVACSGCTGRAVYTSTRLGLTPAIRAGKGWRGRRES